MAGIRFAIYEVDIRSGEFRTRLEDLMQVPFWEVGRDRLRHYRPSINPVLTGYSDVIPGQRSGPGESANRKDSVWLA